VGGAPFTMVGDFFLLVEHSFPHCPRQSPFPSSFMTFAHAFFPTSIPGRAGIFPRVGVDSFFSAFLVRPFAIREPFFFPEHGAHFSSEKQTSPCGRSRGYRSLLEIRRGILFEAASSSLFDPSFSFWCVVSSPKSFLSFQPFGLDFPPFSARE